MYNWLRSAPREEIATVFQCLDEDDPSFWLKHKQQDWPKMFAEGLTSEHSGDCTSRCWSCKRRHSEYRHKQIESLCEVLEK